MITPLNWSGPALWQYSMESHLSRPDSSSRRTGGARRPITGAERRACNRRLSATSDAGIDLEQDLRQVGIGAEVHGPLADDVQCLHVGRALA